MMAVTSSAKLVSSSPPSLPPVCVLDFECVCMCVCVCYAAGYDGSGIKCENWSVVVSLPSHLLLVCVAVLCVCVCVCLIVCVLCCWV